MHAVFRGSTALYRAQYLLDRQLNLSTSGALDRILCYPLCTQSVLHHLIRMAPRHRASTPQVAVRLPRRLFRPLFPPSGSDPTTAKLKWSWTETAHPLPLLEQLYATVGLAGLTGLVDVNAHEGYALTRAVHAHFVPLIRFLLAHGADPGAKDGLAVVVAIRRRDLGLVRLLIERVDDAKRGTGKRRKLRDRLVVTNEMLRIAVKCDARDIVQYFREEKGLVPDLKTLRTLPSFEHSPVAAMPAHVHPSSSLKRKRR